MVYEDVYNYDANQHFATQPMTQAFDVVASSPVLDLKSEIVLPSANQADLQISNDDSSKPANTAKSVTGKVGDISGRVLSKASKIASQSHQSPVSQKVSGLGIAGAEIRQAFGELVQAEQAGDPGAPQARAMLAGAMASSTVGTQALLQSAPAMKPAWAS